MSPAEPTFSTPHKRTRWCDTCSKECHSNDEWRVVMPGEISRSYKGPKDGRVPSWLDDEKQVWDGYTIHAGKRHVPQPPASPPTSAEVVVRLSTVAKFPSIGEYAQSAICDAIALLLAAPAAW